MYQQREAHTCTHAHTNTVKHTHTYAQTHTHTHTHTQRRRIPLDVLEFREIYFTIMLIWSNLICTKLSLERSIKGFLTRLYLKFDLFYATNVLINVKTMFIESSCIRSNSAFYINQLRILDCKPTLFFINEVFLLHLLDYFRF